MLFMDKLVVFLNGDRGTQVLQAIAASNHRPTLIIAGAEGLLKHPVVVQVTQLWGAKSIFEKRVNSDEFIQLVKGYSPELFVVAGFSTIFKRWLLTVPSLGTINLHGGALPKYRGGSPLNWQIINDEPDIGISIIEMDEGIDTGAILSERNFPLKESDTISSIHNFANGLFSEMVVQLLGEYEADKVKKRTQDVHAGEYWHQRQDDDGHIDFSSMTARQVFNLVRGTTKPYPGAFAYYHGEKIRFWACEVPAFKIRGVPGRVCRISGQGPFVVCADHAIRIVEASHQLMHGALLI